MISGKLALTHLHIPTASVLRAIQVVRNQVETASNPMSKANDIIEKITGVHTHYTDIKRALHVAQHVTESAMMNDQIDPELEIVHGEERSARIFAAHPWLTAKEDTAIVSGATAAVVEGIDVKVAVHADGKIKKGGKQILAAELYKKYVIDAETPVDNQGFIKVLIKELGMTKAGATTYNYNMKKQFGGNIDPKVKK